MAISRYSIHSASELYYRVYNHHIWRYDDASLSLFPLSLAGTQARCISHLAPMDSCQTGHLTPCRVLGANLPRPAYPLTVPSSSWRRRGRCRLSAGMKSTRTTRTPVVRRSCISAKPHNLRTLRWVNTTWCTYIYIYIYIYTCTYLHVFTSTTEEVYMESYNRQSYVDTCVGVAFGQMYLPCTWIAC